jgi:SAM-dependent methyltransferase
VTDEVDHIRQRYQRRAALPSDRYSFVNPSAFLAAQSLDRAVMSMLLDAELTDFAHLRLLEVGCGTGGNLLRFIRWGFDPANLAGNDLLEERAAVARSRLPASVTIDTIDASTMGAGDFDIVHQSMVLSSILEDDLQQRVADAMWRMTAPGGVVLSYDFVYGNPSNPDVRAVTNRRLRHLFPHGDVHARSVTLAPPIARTLGDRVATVHALERLRPLRTHSLAIIRKPAGESRGQGSP